MVDKEIIEKLPTSLQRFYELLLKCGINLDGKNQNAESNKNNNKNGGTQFFDKN